jgi:hypothetical protein
LMRIRADLHYLEMDHEEVPVFAGELCQSMNALAASAICFLPTLKSCLEHRVQHRDFCLDEVQCCLVDFDHLRWINWLFQNPARLGAASALLSGRSDCLHGNDCCDFRSLERVRELFLGQDYLILAGNGTL